METDMPTAPFRSADRSPNHWIALLAIALLGAIQIYFYDITFHGPDQIRDMEIARKLIHDGEWPLRGPPLFGERLSLPPGFYYLLAAPLLIRDSEVSVFIAFGILFALSVWYLWRNISACFGPRCALVYAVLAFPVFSSLYTHSAWNPALVMTLSNVLLGLFIQLVQHRRHDWLALPLVAFLLVQIHPSAAPLLVGFAAYVLLNPRVLSSPKTITTVLVIIGMTAWWAVKSGIVEKLQSTAAHPAAAQPTQGWLANLLDVGKWHDVLLMPYSTIAAIEPGIAPLKILTGILLVVMLAGLLLCIAACRTDRTIRWVGATTVLWFVVSMAFLSQGAFWHLDVIHPWLALLAAFGLARASDRLRLSGLRFHGLAIAAFVLVLSAHGIFYGQLVKRGKYDLLVAPLFFPKLEEAGFKIPGYTYRYLDDLRTALAGRGICQADIAGLSSMLVRDATNRTFQLPSCAPATPQSRDYFIHSRQDAARFDFTKGLEIIGSAGETDILAVRPLGIRINGVATHSVTSDSRLDYMTYLPARLEGGLTIALAHQPEITLRVALRCGRDYPMQEPGSWVLQGAGAKKPLVSAHHRYLGSNYYDLEWTLALPPGASEATVSSTLGAIDCDVSAIARAPTADAAP
jgi:hypothetical protein